MKRRAFTGGFSVPGLAAASGLAQPPQPIARVAF